MALAALGYSNAAKRLGYSPDVLDRYFKWSEEFCVKLDDSVSYLPIDILHLYHDEPKKYGEIRRSYYA